MAQLTATEDSIRAQGRTHFRRTSELSNPEVNNFQRSPDLQSGWSYPNGISPSGHSSIDRNGVVESPADPSPAHSYENTKHRSNSSLSNSMMRTVVASGNDALNILFEAATAQEDSHTDNSPESVTGAPSTGPSNALTPGNYDAAFEPITRVIRPVQLSNASQDTLNIWEACRFVKMGWFTAREAVTFVDLSVSWFQLILCLHANSVIDSTRTCRVYRRFSQTFTPIIAITIGSSLGNQSFVAPSL